MHFGKSITCAIIRPWLLIIGIIPALANPPDVSPTPGAASTEASTILSKSTPSTLAQLPLCFEPNPGSTRPGYNRDMPRLAAIEQYRPTCPSQHRAVPTAVSIHNTVSA